MQSFRPVLRLAHAGIKTAMAKSKPCWGCRSLQGKAIGSSTQEKKCTRAAAQVPDRERGEEGGPMSVMLEDL